MSWLFSQALVAEYSRAISWDGAPSSPLSVMPTPHKFWHNDKMMECSTLSRFGLMSSRLTVDRGQALLTWYREGFPARTSASPVKAQASTAPAADSGDTWPGSFARWDPSTRGWKTHRFSLLEGSEQFLGTWPTSGLMLNGECYRRKPLVLGTSAKESGSLLPTLDASQGNHRLSGDTQSAKSLEAMARTGKLALLPKLAARDWRYPNAKTFAERTGKQSASEQLPNFLRGPLNPDWCEWFMGFPSGWTALEPLAMPKFLEWQQQHSSRPAPLSVRLTEGEQ